MLLQLQLCRRRLRWISLLGGVLTVCGCVQREGVETYTVERVTADRPAASPVGNPHASPGQAWFFKLMGGQEAVQAEADAFASLMASVRFNSAGLPEWETPAGWTDRKESGMRYATLVHEGDEPPLEIAISALPSDDPGGDAYLKSNIDRWRGQVGLGPYAGADWKQQAADAGELRESETANGRVVLVQLTGQDPAGAPVTMLAAIVPRPSAAPPAGSSAGPPTAASAASPTYAVPAEWTAQPPGQFQLASWLVTDGGQEVKVSLSQSGGTLDMNIARWRNQVGLGPDAESTTQQVTVGGREATRVELPGAEQAIIGVIVPDGPMGWFFKMMGPPELVDRERERFHAFIDSVEFP